MYGYRRIFVISQLLQKRVEYYKIRLCSFISQHYMLSNTCRKNYNSGESTESGNYNQYPDWNCNNCNYKGPADSGFADSGNPIP